MRIYTLVPHLRPLLKQLGEHLVQHEEFTAGAKQVRVVEVVGDAVYVLQHQIRVITQLAQLHQQVIYIQQRTFLGATDAADAVITNSTAQRTAQEPKGGRLPPSATASTSATTSSTRASVVAGFHLCAEESVHFALQARQRAVHDALNLRRRQQLKKYAICE